MAEQDEHPAVKRQQIIQGAEVVFTECGYEGASMSRIAAEACVSKGTLYNYFAGKSELFSAFVSQKAESTLSQVFEPIAEQEDARATLHRIAHRMMAIMLSPGSLVLYRIVIAEAGKFPQLAEVFWKSGPERALDHMAGWLDGQMQAGRLRPADPRLAADQFFSLCQTSTSLKCRLQLGPAASPAELALTADHAVRLFLDSYSAPAGPPPPANPSPPPAG